MLRTNSGNHRPYPCLLALLVGMFSVASTIPASIPAGAKTQDDCRYFTETAKTVCGRFLEYWTLNGGLMQQGYPVSEQFLDRSATDGRFYTVQYFERAVFEHHPENQPPYDVLLSLLGAFEYKERYGAGNTPNQKPSLDNPIFFEQTKKTLGGRFRQYWEENGGLSQQGHPITDEFEEVSALNGKTYKVQYFERAVFEYHPENQPPYDVLLSQLGTLRFRKEVATCAGHLKLRGQAIASGANGQPTFQYELKSYRIEEVGLPSAITCVVDVVVDHQFTREPRTFDRFWRISVTGEKVDFPQGLNWYIWFDDTIVGSSGPGKNKELVTLIYDPQLLREGATVGVSYGLTGPRETISQKVYFATKP